MRCRCRLNSSCALLGAPESRAWGRLELRKEARVPTFQECAHGLRGCTHDQNAKYFGRIRRLRSCDPRLDGAGACAAGALGAAVSATGGEPAVTPAAPRFRCMGTRTSSASGASLRGTAAASGAPHAAGRSGGAPEPARGQLTLEISPWWPLCGRPDRLRRARKSSAVRPATAPRRRPEPWEFGRRRRRCGL